MKDNKAVKIAGKVANGLIDILPGGSTARIGIKRLLNKKLDRNNDGKVTLADFKPWELVGVIAGLIILSILASKGVIDIQILKDVAEVLGL